MRNAIQATKAFKALDPTAKIIIRRFTSQVQIKDAVIQARNIGIEKWKAQTDVQNSWKNIVEEIVTNEKK